MERSGEAEVPREDQMVKGPLSALKVLGHHL